MILSKEEIPQFHLRVMKKQEIYIHSILNQHYNHLQSLLYYLLIQDKGYCQVNPV